MRQRIIHRRVAAVQIEERKKSNLFPVVIRVVCRLSYCLGRVSPEYCLCQVIHQPTISARRPVVVGAPFVC